MVQDSAEIHDRARLTWLRFLQRHGQISNESVLAGRFNQRRQTDGSVKTYPVVTLLPCGQLGNRLFQIAALLSAGLEEPHELSVAFVDYYTLQAKDSVFRALRSLYARPSFLDMDDNSFSRLVGEGIVVCKACSIVETYKHDIGKYLYSGVSSCAGLDAHGHDRDHFCHGFDYPYLRWSGDNWALYLALAVRQTHEELRNQGGCPVFRLNGYFQDQRYFMTHFSWIRRLFLDADSLQRAANLYDSLVPLNGTALSIHFRLEDGYPWKLDGTYYTLASMMAQMYIPPGLLCIIFSDRPKVARKKSSRLRACSRRIIIPANVDPVTSLYMMSLCPYKILAPSTLSYWAGMLGPSGSFVMSPDTGVDSLEYLTQPRGWMLIPARIVK